MPKVSVVIPCYNLGQYLDEAVDSVLGQSFQDHEILVVNDGSTDPFTQARVEAQRQKPGVQVYTTDNQGLAATRNFGIERAAGNYICCLDADDRYHRQFLAACVPLLDQDQEQHLGFVTTMVKVFGEENAYWPCADFDPAALLVENNVHVASLFRKSCWQKVGGYDLALAGFQDWNFWIAIVAQGFRWARVKRPLFHYRVRSGSMLERSEQRRRSLKKSIVANHLDFFLTHAPEVFDLYEEKLQQQQAASRQREVEVAKTALAKLQQLFAEHQKLKQQHQTLIQAYSGKKRL